MQASNILRFKKWDDQKIQKLQFDVNLAIRQMTHGKSRQEKLLHILKEMQLHSNSYDINSLLRCYTFAIFALQFHDRYGGLKKTQINDVAKTATAVLKVIGVKCGSSRSSALYSNIHGLISQIQRKDGQHWRAAWEHAKTDLTCRAQDFGGHSYRCFVLGNRSFRLGHLNSAIGYYKEALINPAFSGLQKDRCALELVKALRLCGRSEESSLLFSKFYAELSSSKGVEQEWQWEEIVAHSLKSGEFGKMIRAVEKNGSHHVESYIIEASLFVMIPITMNWQKKITKLFTYQRRPNFHWQSQGFFLEALIGLNQCYETTIPFSRRVDRLGEILNNTNKLVSIEHELLVCAAAVRFITRSRSKSFSRLIVDKYKGMCIQATRGEINDCFGHLSDIIAGTDNLD